MNPNNHDQNNLRMNRFGLFALGDGQPNVQETDGEFVIASGNTWMPGRYATREAAELAFTFCPDKLTELRDRFAPTSLSEADLLSAGSRMCEGCRTAWRLWCWFDAEHEDLEDEDYWERWDEARTALWTRREEIGDGATLSVRERVEACPPHVSRLVIAGRLREHGCGRIVASVPLEASPNEARGIVTIDGCAGLDRCERLRLVRYGRGAGRQVLWIEEIDGSRVLWRVDASRRIRDGQILYEPIALPDLLGEEVAFETVPRVRLLDHDATRSDGIRVVVEVNDLHVLQEETVFA